MKLVRTFVAFALLAPLAAAQNTVADVIGNDENLSTTEIILKATLNFFPLSGMGPFTVFAPVNQAYVDAGLSVSDIENTDPDVLQNTIEYHIISENIVLAEEDLPKSYRTLAGPSITVLQNADGDYELDGIHGKEALVIGNGRSADNGMVYEIDTVMRPPGSTREPTAAGTPTPAPTPVVVDDDDDDASTPMPSPDTAFTTPVPSPQVSAQPTDAAPTGDATGTVDVVVESNDDLLILSTLLKQTGLDEALSGTGPFTLFAPNNQAFNDIGISVGPARKLQELDPSVRETLLYHVVPEDLDPLQSGTHPTLFEGQPIVVTQKIDGSFELNNESANVTGSEDATNGHVYIIDAVLLRPPTAPTPAITPTPPTVVAPQPTVGVAPDTTPAPSAAEAVPTPSPSSAVETTPAPSVTLVDDDDDAPTRMPSAAVGTEVPTAGEGTEVPTTGEGTEVPTTGDGTPAPSSGIAPPTVPTAGEATELPTAGEGTELPTAGEETEVPTAGEETEVPTAAEVPTPILIFPTPTGGDATDPPTGTEETTDPPTAGEGPATDPPTAEEGTGSPAPDEFAITPMNFEGCMEVDGTDDGDGLTLAECESGEVKQEFRYDDFLGLFESAAKDNLCLQAGSGEEPIEGRGARMYTCNPEHPLQQFDWASALGSPIKLKLFPDWCIVFRGINANLGNDPITVKTCDLVEEARREGWMADV